MTMICSVFADMGDWNEEQGADETQAREAFKTLEQLVEASMSNFVTRQEGHWYSADFTFQDEHKAEAFCTFLEWTTDFMVEMREGA